MSDDDIGVSLRNFAAFSDKCHYPNIVPNLFRIRISNVLKKVHIPPIRKVNQPASFKDSCSYSFISEHLVN